uniref:Uncharacterized protein n=1 Tax=Cannabis sativa TaxID=3483 RepID=A0A803PJ48_CANSA
MISVTIGEPNDQQKTRERTTEESPKNEQPNDARTGETEESICFEWAISSLRDLLAVEIMVTVARHSRSIMARTKQTCCRAPPYDPHIAMLVTRGRVGIVEEAA